jgi:hypothetical protein
MKSLKTSICVFLLLALPLPLFGMTDNFDDGNDNGWTVIQGDWEVKNGKYVQSDILWTVTDTKETYHRSFIGDVGWSDYTVEVDLTIDDPGELAAIAGIFIRVSEKSTEGDYYFFRIDLRPDNPPGAIQSPNHIFDGTAIRLEGADPEFNDMEEADVTYHLKVVAEGNHFMYYIDNELMLDRFDDFDPFMTGAVGLGTFNAGASFDNFSVVGAGIPGAVSREGKLAVCWGNLKK